MRIYDNRNSGAITTDPAVRQTISAGDLFCKRGDSPPLQLAFHRDGAIELPVAPLITFIVKKLGDFTGAAIIEATSFTTPVDTTGFYVMQPDLTSDTLHEQLLAQPVNSRPANATARKALTGLTNGQIVQQMDTDTYYQVKDATQLAADAGWTTDASYVAAGYVDFAAEIVLRESPNFGEESSQSFVLRIWVDYERGGETPPAPGTPFSQGLVLNRFDITALTGGVAGDLDAVATAGGLVAPNTLIFKAGAPPFVWRLVPSATIVSSSVANPTVITTLTPHGLVVGQSFAIGGHAGSTPALNGTATVNTVIDGTHFTISTNVTVAGTGGYVTPATDAAGGIVRPVDFNAATNAVAWQSVL